MNKNIKTEGIILRRVNLNDADQIITVLTSDYGKMSFFGKGCRRTKSRFCGKLETLQQIKITAFQGQNLAYLNEVESLAPRSLSETELRTQSILFYLAELTNRLIQDHQQIEGVYQILSDTLDCIDRESDKSELALYAYVIKLLSLLGFMAPWDSCARSNAKLDLTEPLFLNLQEGSVVRSGYNSPLDPRLTPPLIKWVNFMQKADFTSISKVAPAKGERIQVWTMIKMMLENLLTSPVKAEEFMVRI